MNVKDALKNLIDNPKQPNVSEWVYEVEAILEEINENNEEAWILIDGIKKQGDAFQRSENLVALLRQLIKKKYDNVLYQVVLQTLNYIFTISSEYQLIDTVVLNGKVHTIDRATGNEIEPCILSISVARDAFEGLNLEAIDPKAWFRSAKGVSAVTLANIAPVAPVVSMSRED